MANSSSAAGSFGHRCGNTRDHRRCRAARRRQSGTDGDGLHEHGHGRQSRRHRGAGRVAGAGLVLAALLAVPVVAALLAAGRLLAAFGYAPALAAEIGDFLGAIAWAAPGFLGFAVLRGFLVAASHSRTVMIASLLCIPMNAGLNWILVFGHLGAPALGIAGS